MIRGLYTAATSMQTQMNKMDIITNNMANANTIGYKKDAMVQDSFSLQLAKRIEKMGDTKVGTVSLGVGTSNVVTNFDQGNMVNTGGKLDVALSGDGFFVVSSKNGDRYTRAGNFTLNNNGDLTDANGNLVESTTGQAIHIGTGEVGISNRGCVMVDNVEVGTIKVVDFADKAYLTKEGDGLFKTKEGATEKAFEGTVIQGFTEGSNVNSVREMVNMITLNRNYEANSKVIQTEDNLLDKAVNDIGRL
ncbi:MAG: flagellar basal-body rod protein FlgF [Clostridia bacterium]|nr:flagellar basal-body rod protein FlgF [Clostridia bacterium]